MDISIGDRFGTYVLQLENRLRNPIEGKFWGYMAKSVPGCYRKLQPLYDALLCYGMLIAPLEEEGPSESVVLSAETVAFVYGRLNVQHIETTSTDKILIEMEKIQKIMETLIAASTLRLNYATLQLERVSTLGNIITTKEDDNTERNIIIQKVQSLRSLLESADPSMKYKAYANIKARIRKGGRSYFWESIAVLFLLNAGIALNILKDDPACNTEDGAPPKGDKSTNLPRIKRFATNTTSSPGAGKLGIEQFKADAITEVQRILKDAGESATLVEQLNAEYTLELSTKFPVPPGMSTVKLESLRKKLAAAIAAKPATTQPLAGVTAGLNLSAAGGAGAAAGGGGTMGGGYRRTRKRRAAKRKTKKTRSN